MAFSSPSIVRAAFPGYEVETMLQSATEVEEQAPFRASILLQKLEAELLDAIPGATRNDLPRLRHSLPFSTPLCRVRFERYDRVRRWLELNAPQIKRLW